MVWFDILVVLGFAVILSAALTHGLRWRHPVREDAGAAMVFLFVIFFLTMWAVLLWVPPVGPVYFGQSWSGVLLAAFFVALLLAAAVPPRRSLRKPPGVADEEEAVEKTVTTAFGCFFWILLIVLVGAIAVRFFQL